MIEGYCKPKQVEKTERPSDWHIELKYDGTRHFLIQPQTEPKLYNKRGTEKTRHFPDITRNIKIPEGTVLDGETIVTDELHPHGNKNVLQSRDGGQPVISKSGRKNFKPKMKMNQYPATFIAFDVLKYKGENMRDKPIEKRREILEEICSNADDSLKVSKKFDRFSQAWNEVTENKMEGLILKEPESTYPKGRDRRWKKVKNHNDTILECRSYEEHSKGITVTARDEHSDQHRVTVNGRVSEEVKKQIDDGEAEIEVSYLERTDNGKLREPHFKRKVEE